MYACFKTRVDIVSYFIPFGVVVHHAPPGLPQSGPRVEVSPEAEGRGAGLVDPVLEEAFAGGHSVDQVQHPVVQPAQDQHHQHCQNLCENKVVLFSLETGFALS